jgi:hypothetical protein
VTVTTAPGADTLTAEAFSSCTLTGCGCGTAGAKSASVSWQGVVLARGESADDGLEPIVDLENRAHDGVYVTAGL